LDVSVTILLILIIMMTIFMLYMQNMTAESWWIFGYMAFVSVGLFGWIIYL